MEINCIYGYGGPEPVPAHTRRACMASISRRISIARHSDECVRNKLAPSLSPEATVLWRVHGPRNCDTTTCSLQALTAPPSQKPRTLIRQAELYADWLYPEEQMQTDGSALHQY